MRKLIHAILLVALLTCFARADEVDDYVSAFIKRHGIPGAAISVVRDGKLVKAAAYGSANLELNVAAGNESVFEIGSISKQFCAEAVMMLVEDGKVKTEDLISKYIPESPAAWREIRIRHLLTHTSGLPDWEAGNLLSYRREYSAKEYIDLIGTHPLDFVPGSSWAYTNSAFPLLGMVVERVSGMPYEQFVAERIFKPAGMKTARFRHAEQITLNRAAGYVDINGELHNGEPLRPGILAPNGGILASALDLAAWDIALHGGLLLRSETLEHMIEPVTLDNGSRGASGMAWFSLAFHGHPMILHNGSTVGGYSSVVYHYTADHLGVAVLLNVDRWNAVNTLAEHVAGMFVPGVSISSLPPLSSGDDDRSRKFVGFLRELAAGKDPEMLAPSLRGHVNADRRKSAVKHLTAMKSEACIDVEDFGPAGHEQFGNVIRWTERYRIETDAGAVYYTLNLSGAGKVVRFVPEED